MYVFLSFQKQVSSISSGVYTPPRLPFLSASSLSLCVSLLYCLIFFSHLHLSFSLPFLLSLCFFFVSFGSFRRSLFPLLLLHCIFFSFSSLFLFLLLLPLSQLFVAVTEDSSLIQRTLCLSACGSSRVTPLHPLQMFSASSSLLFPIFCFFSLRQ
ncbi:hypothetical protein CSUI_001185 [Cystoisospora suis]|uniref:Transmembrane protein n=1 Tax=Cystoisospora suis TaxID=483139 RepID=A0A2C6KYD1_9APIC|nr:hypothetical protein CSUI_001185 [Cystoisospora suis]